MVETFTQTHSPLIYLDYQSVEALSLLVTSQVTLEKSLFLSDSLLNDDIAFIIIKLKDRWKQSYLVMGVKIAK